MTRRAASTIPLDRVFLQVPASAAGLDADAIIVAASLLNRAETWPQVLSHPYVVVLGEAGTGKSTEFLLQADALTANQQFAVFVEVVDLATDGLAASIEPDDNARLEEWRHGDGPGVFFLDSLDEAKLRQRTLRQALRRLRLALTKEWARVRLVISCRASDWMAEADRAEVLAIVPNGSEAGVHVVQLAPLNSTQVEKLATHAGVVDVPRFMRAINDNYAQIFIERPLDVQWLGGYWVRHGRIGNLRELVADNIREKLKERPGRSTTLALRKAEAGLQALAGIATINNRWSFLVPDEALDAQRAVGAVDPQDVLPNWSADEIQQLLRRPIFDESTYGRVRLHHRSVQEFLAAEWLASLSAAGLSRSSLDELLFRRDADDTAIPIHLGPVAAWLALWDQELREELIAGAPALLIGQGDPAGLTPDERQKTLRAYSRGYEDRHRRFDRFDNSTLRRFSSPVFADQVAALLADPAAPDEFCAFLLRLVELGPIGDCLAIALSLALDQKRSGQVRCSAIRAAAGLGTDEHRRALLTLVDTTEHWEQDVAGAFVRALYPEPLGVSDLMKVISKAAPKRRNLMTSLQVVLEHEIPTLGDTDLRLRLLRGLLAEVWRSEGDGGVPSGHQFLPTMVGNLVSSILDDLPSAAPHPAEIASALELLRCCNQQGFDIWPILENLKKAVAGHSEVRRMLFWRRVEAHRRREGVTPTRYHKLRDSYEIFDLSGADEDWLALDASNRMDVREKLLAFDALARLPQAEDAQQERSSLLREVAATSPALTKRLNRMLNPSVHWPPLSHSRERKWQARELARKRRNQQRRAELEASIEGIRDGTNVNALWFLVDEAEHGHAAYGEASEDALRHRFGEEIADAAVTGWRAFWRSFDPPLPHERERRNTTPGRVILGLVGLHKDFSMGLEGASLTPEEVRLAVRYAACELNSFPSWLAGLARTHPNVVVEALKPALTADYQHPDNGELVNDVLAKLPRADDTVKVVCAPVLAAALTAGEPPMTQALAEALSVVTSVGIIDQVSFDELAADRCLASISTPGRFAIWWCCWLAQNPSAALELFETILDEVEHDLGYQLVLQVCDQLHENSEEFGLLPISLQREPSTLARLIPIVYEYVKFSADIEHEGTFSPGPRDNAQWLRGQLVTWLADMPGSESVAVLRQLADDARLSDIRDRLLYKADQRLVANAGISKPNVVSVLSELYRKHGTEALESLRAKSIPSAPASCDNRYSTEFEDQAMGTEQNREAALSKLFTELFDDNGGGLLQWVRLNLGKPIHDELPAGLSLSQLA